MDSFVAVTSSDYPHRKIVREVAKGGNAVPQWDVIVVDDEPHNLNVVEITLKYFGSKVRSCLSGEECLRQLEICVPTFALIDIQMPKMNGLMLLERIRADRRFADMPAIALTAYAMLGDRERFLAAGFTGYIPKPISPPKMVEEIGSILKVKQFV